MKIIFNSNQIQTQSEKAVLIKLPKSDFAFWHPKKFVSQKGKGGYKIIAWFGNESWTITARRTGANLQILDEKELTVAEAVEQYNLEVA